MKWMSVKVTTTSEGSDIVAQALIDCGSYGASIESAADIEELQKPAGSWDMIDPSVYENVKDGAKVTGYFRMDQTFSDNLSSVRQKLAWLRNEDFSGIDLGVLEMSQGELEEEDWTNSWKRFYKPTRIGKRLVVKPTWETYSPKDGDLIIEMDPGTAFGTGTHETTSMCLELAEKYVKTGDSAIDVGCGTAILSLASALLGANEIVAVDIDLLAVDCAVQNVAQNKMEGLIKVVHGDLLTGTDGSFDVVFANIVAGVIIMLLPDVPSRLKKGGHFICSGIIRDREAEVVSTLEAAGFMPVEILRKGEWVAMCWKNG